MSRLALVVALALIAGAPTRAQPVPPQNVAFERWARETFFGGYKPASPTQRWDVPATANRERGGVPVTFKAATHGAAVELGDALRQYEIDEPFLMIVAYWQPGANPGRVVQVLPLAISAVQWRKLWGPVTYADLQRLDGVMRDTGPTVEETRRRVLAMKNAPPFSQAIIQLNPRIDERGPRRLQCSLRYRDVITLLAPGTNPDPQDPATLYGVAVPAPAAGAR